MAETVVTFLAAHELSMYAAAFDEHGWDSLSALRDISDADLVQLEKDVAIKSGHSSRLRRALGKVVAPAAPAVPAAPAAPPPATQEAEHEADPAQAEVPPSQAAAGVAGGADAGADATAAATGDAAVLQKKLFDVLRKRNSMGVSQHGTTIEVYQAPSGDKQVMIKMADATYFYCLCCPIPASNTNGGARKVGGAFCNALTHMGTKEHWTNFRRRVYNLQFDEAAWLEFTFGNTHGPARAKRTAQHQSRAADTALKREAKQARGAHPPPPAPPPGMQPPPGMSAPGAGFGPSPSPGSGSPWQ